ncbi:hypothetical protein [Caudoviricetes sp.]|nr:hypothetical protein [Caudoviricetes sp.]UOF79117.1 hypothetical protein [Caudoviricetes sp.]
MTYSKKVLYLDSKVHVVNVSIKQRRSKQHV